MSTGAIFAALRLCENSRKARKDARDLAEGRRKYCQPFLPFRTQILNGFEKLRMVYSRSDIGPTVRLNLNFFEFLALLCIEDSACGTRKAVQIELNLLCQALVNEHPQFQIVFHRLRNLRAAV